MSLTPLALTLLLLSQSGGATPGDVLGTPVEAPAEPPAEAPPPEPTPAPPADAPVAAEEPPRIAPVHGAPGGEEPTAEALAPTQGFVKGELSMYLGSDRLTVKRNRVGVSAGLDQFEQAFYLLAEPLLDLRFLDDKLGVGFGVPLRLELFNFENGADGQPLAFSRAGRVRTEDYDRLHDFGRVLKYVTYGRKEDHLYVNVGQRYASTVGHGALVRRYAPNIDVNYPRASAQLDAYNDLGGFELLTNDVLEWNQLAGIAFIKPFSALGAKGTLLKSVSLGVSGAVDWKAPWQLKTDPVTGVRLLDGDKRLQVDTRLARLVGLDLEVKVVKTANVDIKPYVDYSMLLDGDGGLTIGVLGRFNAGTETVNAFRVVTELRVLGSRYQPAYFDTFYEVERFVFRELPRVDPNVALYATKLETVLDQGLGQRLGFYAEASWGIPGKVGLTLAFEGTSNDPGRNLIAHLELPLFNFLQVFGSYYKRGLTSFSELGALDEKTILFAGARLQILPFFFVNGRAYKTFRMNEALQRYDNQFGFVIDAEVGWEFGGKRDLPPPPPLEETPATETPPGPETSAPDAAPPAEAAPDEAPPIEPVNR